MNPTRREDTIEVPAAVTRAYLVHHRICPRMLSADRTLTLAAASDAFLDHSIFELAVAYDARSVTVEQAEWAEVQRSIDRLFSDTDPIHALDVRPDVDDIADARDVADQPPVVRYVNTLIRAAFEGDASDVHIEATRQGVDVRIRVDGVLQSVEPPPSGLHRAVVSRVKLLAELDIAERRKPQDGRIRVRLESREIDVRVSTVPTLFGESVVLRLLERGGKPVEWQDLGMPTDVLRSITQIAVRPHGMLIATGPTGSGKTTTLYGMLQRRNLAVEKVVTVEDPVEYQLPNVTQVPVQQHAGVTFATVLRSILRQDPDVIMVGEMRDEETAGIAMQAALTGHFALSTLHTNDASGAIPRLLDLGVPPYMIGATVEGAARPKSAYGVRVQ